MAGNAKGRAALVVAAGLLIAASAPALAEPSDFMTAATTQPAQPVGKPMSLAKPTIKKVTKAHARRKLASRSRKMVHAAAKPRPATTIAAKAEAIADNSVSVKILPVKVADARAEIASATADDAREAASPLEVAAADQMNALDRALAEPSAAVNVDQAAVPAPSAPAAAPAAESPPGVAAPAASPQTVAVASAPRPSNESSLIGKIFIAFGGLLTLASAARMLIA